VRKPMRSKQLRIPGLEGLEKAAASAQEKQKTLREQLQALKSRMLALEIEVSLLKILLEKGAEDEKDGDKDHA